MAKSCKALITHVFNELKTNRIQICADVANVPSCQVPERLGFAKEGINRVACKLAQGLRDCTIYSMQVKEWRE